MFLIVLYWINAPRLLLKPDTFQARGHPSDGSTRYFTFISAILFLWLRSQVLMTLPGFDDSLLFQTFFCYFFLTNFILICLDSWGLAIVILYFNFLHIMSCCGIFLKKYINSTWASIFYIIKNSSQLARATYLVKNYENS
jgi:hypothetical protein